MSNWIRGNSRSKRSNRRMRWHLRLSRL
jgi:hypothetical protein